MKRLNSFLKDKISFNKGKKSVGVVMATAIVFSSTVGIGVYNESTKAYEVKVGKEVVGIVSEKNRIDQVVKTIEQEKSSEYEKEVELEEVIVVNEVKAKKDDLSQTKELKNQIEKKVAVLSDAITVSIDGNRVVALNTEPEAEKLITELKQKNLDSYGNENTVDVGIAEDVKTEKEKVKVSEIKTVEEALETVESGRPEQLEHIVAAQESYLDIAASYGVSPESLQEANPEKDLNALLEGEALKVNMIKPYVTVKLIDKVKTEQVIPYETAYDYDSGMYSDNEEIREEGVNGILQKELKVTSVNGNELAAELVDEKVIEEPVKRLIVQGTKERPVGVGTGQLQTPSRGYISSRFGPRWGTVHRGLDIAAPVGTPIVASDSGKVEYAAFNNGGYGYMVKVNHGNGYVTLYAHASQIYVKPGDTVAKGDMIAAVGNTGNSTGPHLHFEVIENGMQVNPEPFL